MNDRSHDPDLVAAFARIETAKQYLNTSHIGDPSWPVGQAIDLLNSAVGHLEVFLADMQARP